MEFCCNSDFIENWVEAGLCLGIFLKGGYLILAY